MAGEGSGLDIWARAFEGEKGRFEANLKMSLVRVWWVVGRHKYYFARWPLLQPSCRGVPKYGALILTVTLHSHGQAITLTLGSRPVWKARLVCSLSGCCRAIAADRQDCRFKISKYNHTYISDVNATRRVYLARDISFDASYRSLDAVVKL
jgi:hypothetical protein